MTSRVRGRSGDARRAARAQSASSTVRVSVGRRAVSHRRTSNGFGSDDRLRKADSLSPNVFRSSDATSGAGSRRRCYNWAVEVEQDRPGTAAGRQVAWRSRLVPRAMLFHNESNHVWDASTNCVPARVVALTAWWNSGTSYPAGHRWPPLALIVTVRSTAG